MKTWITNQLLLKFSLGVLESSCMPIQATCHYCVFCQCLFRYWFEIYSALLSTQLLLRNTILSIIRIIDSFSITFSLRWLIRFDGVHYCLNLGSKETSPLNEMKLSMLNLKCKWTCRVIRLRSLSLEDLCIIKSQKQRLVNIDTKTTQSMICAY